MKKPKKLDKHEIEICHFYDKLKAVALRKYRKGKREHGTDTSGVDYAKEIFCEMLDTINYAVMSGIFK